MTTQPMLIRPVFLCLFLASCGAYHLLFQWDWLPRALATAAIVTEAGGGLSGPATTAASRPRGA
jgi:hypothetical protein